jgi:hypothetical protein
VENLKAYAEVNVSCEASFIDVLKWTRGEVDPTYDWEFALYEGPDGYGGTQVGNTSSTLDDVDGILDFGDPVPALNPTKAYTVCELGNASASVNWYAEWSIDGEPVTPYNPEADLTEPEDNGIRCLDIGADTIAVGETLHITVNNRFLDGDARTPGYWKNWNNCSNSNGKQYEKTLPINDPDGEYTSLEEALGDGITWGEFTIDDCDTAVAILDKRNVDTGKKMANDAAYNLATALLAYQLNMGAGVPSCYEATSAANAAEELLVGLKPNQFDGTDKYLRPKDSEYAYANELEGILDNFNNNELCD